MPRPRGHNCGTHAEPPSELEDAVPLSPSHAVGNVPVSDGEDLFQRTVLLTEAMNRLKRRVNEEKHACHLNQNHIEVVSSDEEELDVPIASIPLASNVFPPLAPLNSLPTVLPLEPDPEPANLVNSMHIPTPQDPPVATMANPDVLPSAACLTVPP